MGWGRVERQASREATGGEERENVLGLRSLEVREWLLTVGYLIYKLCFEIGHVSSLTLPTLYVRLRA